MRLRGQRNDPAALLPGIKPCYPLYRKMGGPQGQSEWARIKSPPPPPGQTPDRPAHSKSLLWLCCPGPLPIYYMDKHLHHALIISGESDVLYKLGGVAIIIQINFLLLLQHKYLVYAMPFHNCETRDSCCDLWEPFHSEQSLHKLHS
jgi:hypothetical protein